jgi:hypothetical protein
MATPRHRPAAVEPSIVTASLPQAAAGTAYRHELRAKGGVPFYDWQITSGSLPAGLTLDRFTGTITPTAAGSHTFTVRLRDYDRLSSSVTKTFTLNVGSGGAGPATDLAADAAPSASYTAPWESVAAINDGIDPPSSNDTANPRWGAWPQTGTQWAELTWPSARTIGSAEVYVFDDGGGVRLRRAGNCSTERRRSGFSRSRHTPDRPCGYPLFCGYLPPRHSTDEAEDTAAGGPPGTSRTYERRPGRCASRDLPGRGQPLQAAVTPVGEGPQRLGQVAAERGQRVFGPQRPLVVHLPVDQPVALHLAQRLSQHLLAEPGQPAQQLAGTPRA